MNTDAQVLPFRGDGRREGLVRIGVSVLALVFRDAMRTGGPNAARDSVREHARVTAHALLEAFGPGAAAYAETFARAVIEEIQR